jgi:DNA-binding NarL/FixJ family response regulator
MSERPTGPQAGKGGSGLPAQPRADLSERELEIIELVAIGLTNQEIAQRLTISKRTVDNHVSNIFTKTGAKNRVALLNWAMDHGKICRDGFNCCSLEGNGEGETRPRP